MKRRDAMARLDEAVQDCSDYRWDTALVRSQPSWRAYRRALRALLRERAEAAGAVPLVCSCDESQGPCERREQVRAAVLGRRR